MRKSSHLSWAQKIRGPPRIRQDTVLFLEEKAFVVQTTNNKRIPKTDDFSTFQKENTLMIGYDFPDDEQPTNGQARWASITELSTLLDVSRNTISTAVKRAWANGEPWVKKEKAEDGNTLYLIDTQHEMYLAHQERWKQNKALRAALLEEEMSTWSQADHTHFSPLSSREASFSPYATVPLSWHRQKHSQGVLQRWPRFRQWLYSHGVQVFQNLLADEKQKNLWAWRWGELYGEGFESDEEAIIAALQSRFDAKEAESEEQEYATSFDMLEQKDLQKSQSRRFWFK